MSLIRFFHTVRHLKSRQIAGQIRHRFLPRGIRAERLLQYQVPPFPGCRWESAPDFLPPGPQQNAAADLQTGTFEFLNRRERLGWPPDWDAGNPPKLWQYNLHYFEWLWALEHEAAREVVLDWIARYGPSEERAGWEPYPVSLRLINWCCVFFGKFGGRAAGDERFRDALWRSLFLQAEWLSSRLETRLLGNHLIENGAALFLVGSCFHGKEALEWKTLGENILKREIPEQILPDGMHFELSPMYHLRATYLMGLLSRAGGTDAEKTMVRAAYERMVDALKKLRHPDGGIALFNDSAFAVYNRPDELLNFSGGAGAESSTEAENAAGPWALPDAGYYGYRNRRGAYLICDAGAVGPDYLPGHAHGDIFSFEFSWNHRRMIVDSGVYDYVPGEMRHFCRSTRAHNTVEIGGADQCEFWGAFRVGRRGRARDVSWEPQADGFRLAGWHDGYQRLPGRPRHYRDFDWRASEGLLTLRDRVCASRPVEAVSRIHLHPECGITAFSKDCAEAAGPAGRIQICFEGAGRLEREASLYCPEFGTKIPNEALAFHFSGAAMEAVCRIRVL